MHFIRAIALITFCLPTLSLADGNKKLTDDCQALAKTIATADKSFPLSELKDIKGLVTWRASRCEKPPKAEGNITQLCDSTMAGSGSVLFWQSKTKTGGLKQGFSVCK